MSVDDLLRAYGWDVDAVAEVLESELSAGSTLAMPEADRHFLARHAGVPTATAAERGALAVRHAVLASSQFETALAGKDVAGLLGCSASRVSHRLREGSLYGFKAGGGPVRFPDWQFHDGATLPQLTSVLRAIDPQASPVLVRRFMTRPTDSLGVDEAVSPRTWLLHGGDPGPVALLAATLDAQG